MGLKITLKRKSREFKEMIMRNGRIYTILRCIKSNGDPNLHMLLKGYYEHENGDYVSLLVKHRGPLHPDVKVVYHITQSKVEDEIKKKRTGAGFCATLRNTLNYLYFADWFGFTPVVEWGAVLYYDEGMDSITRNVFEYYFEPVSDISYDEADKCAIVVDAITSHGDYLANRNSDITSYESIDITALSYTYKKYCHLNKKTENFIYDSIHSLINEDECVLAVHFRGTDFGVGLRMHPTAVSIEESLSRATKLFNTGKYDKIFLATDDLDALQAYRKEFGDKLVYYADTYRTSGHYGPHSTPSDRPLHYYKLGLEVLRDVYTLANCDSFVCGLSQVSFAVRYVNLALGRKFKELVVIDNGMNRVSTKEGKKRLHKIGLS